MAPTTRASNVVIGNSKGQHAAENKQRAPVRQKEQPIKKQPLKEQQQEEPVTPRHAPCPSAPRKSPHLEGKSAGLHVKTPESVNPRPPKKKLLERLVEGSDDPTYEPEVEEDESEEGKEDNVDEPATSNLPYVEVNLPDGRVARQCRASKTCPKRWAFIVKRTRMIDHLRTHGLDIDIPCRQQGRPPASETRTRMAPFPNPDVRSWHLQVVRRFAEKDRKFNDNCKRYKRLQ